MAPGFSVTPSGNVVMTNELGLRVSSLPGGGVTAEPALTPYWKRVSRVTALQLALLAYLTSTVYVPLPWYDGEPLRLAVSPRSKQELNGVAGPPPPSSTCAWKKFVSADGTATVTLTSICRIPVGALGFSVMGVPASPVAATVGVALAVAGTIPITRRTATSIRREDIAEGNHGRPQPERPTPRVGAKDPREAGEGTRTPDRLITNQVLYQLSYSGLPGESRLRP